MSQAPGEMWVIVHAKGIEALVVFCIITCPAVLSMKEIMGLALQSSKYSGPNPPIVILELLMCLKLRVCICDWLG